jgi:hypothetical protein
MRHVLRLCFCARTNETAGRRDSGQLKEFASFYFAQGNLLKLPGNYGAGLAQRFVRSDSYVSLNQPESRHFEPQPWCCCEWFAFSKLLPAAPASEESAYFSGPKLNGSKM